MTTPSAYTVELQATETALNVDDISSTTPNNFYVMQNFPNPFNPITMIEYDLPKTEFVSLKIFDIMGREVISLINEIQKPGRKFSIWNAKNNLGQTVSAGMYIYTIQAGSFRKTKKMVLIK